MGVFTVKQPTDIYRNQAEMLPEVIFRQVLSTSRLIMLKTLQIFSEIMEFHMIYNHYCDHICVCGQARENNN